MGKQVKVKVEPTYTDDDVEEQDESYEQEEPISGSNVYSSTGLPSNKIRGAQKDFTDSMVVNEVDLNLYLKNMSRLKTYSFSLLDADLRFIYYNKLAKEHFQGCLNNLKIKSLWQLLIPQSKQRLESLMNSNKKSGLIFKCMIYSKNIKRKTHALKNKTEASIKDIYNKYLKGLSCRIRPIRVLVNSETMEIEGNWNIPKPKRHAILNCYVLQTRLSCRKLALDDSILDDQVIKKHSNRSPQTKSIEQTVKMTEVMDLRIIINQMFTNQIDVCGQTYRNLATKYNTTKQLSKSNSLEGLLFKMMVFYGDYWPMSILKRLYQHTKNMHCEWLLVLNHLTRCFLKENMYGPSHLYVSPEEKPELLKKELHFQRHIVEEDKCDYSEVIKQYDLTGLVPDNINMYDYTYLTSMPYVNKKSKRLTAELSVEGETWIESVAFPHLFLCLKAASQLMAADTNQLSYKYLLKGRLSFIHNLILDKPVNSLADAVMTSYLAYINGCYSQPTTLTHFVAVKLQFANCLLFYYKYTETERCIEVCKQALNIEIEYTGRLGRRTKYQQFDTPQLVIKIEEYKGQSASDILTEYDREVIKKERENLPLIDQVLVLDKKESLDKLKVVDLAQDSILLETPKFTEDNKDETQILSLEKQLVVLTHSYYMYESSPKEELLFSKLNALVISLLASNPPFTLKFPLLALRSLNELPRYKYSDRALEQLQELINQFNTLNKSDDDVCLLMSTPLAYHTRVLLLKMVADKMFEHGLLMTGVEMYQQIGMIEQCIEGLFVAGHKDRAEKMAMELIEKQDGQASPRVLCVLADIRQDPDGYVKAWEVSGMKYARAQKSLARYYFNKKNVAKAIESFRLALKVNTYDPASWFTLGICYMTEKQMEEALKCFSQTVSIDESQGQAWGNLASCYIYLKKMEQAYLTLEQAVKYCEYEWRIWANLMGVSIKIKKFYKYFECIEKLVMLGQLDLITYEVLARVVQVFKFKMAFFNDQKKRAVYAHRQRINRLFEYLKKEMGQRPVVWKYYCQFLEIDLEYYQQMAAHYINKYETGTIDQYDIVPQYSIPAGIVQHTEEMIEETKTKLLQSKQKQCNMIMIVGWETSKKQCQLLLEALKDLHKYQKLFGKEDDKDYNLFMTSVKKKIESCLEINVDLNM